MANITSLREAIAALIVDGDTVALEGFTHLIPFAASHEIIRQGRKNLSYELEALRALQARTAAAHGTTSAGVVA